jgi:putative transposase
MIRKCRAKQDENGKFLKNGQSAKRALNRLIRDCSWGNLKLKIKSVAEKFGLICKDVNPKWTSQKCSHCGHIQKENRNKEHFLCLNCGFFSDADIQASINIGLKGLQALGISPSKLLRVTQKVTAKSESTGSTNGRERSVSLEIEPSKPTHPLTPSWEGELKGVGECVNGEVIPS